MPDPDSSTSREHVRPNDVELDFDFSSHAADSVPRQPASPRLSSSQAARNEVRSGIEATVFRARERDAGLLREMRNRGLTVNEVLATDYEPDSDHAGWKHSSVFAHAWGFLSAKSGPHSEDSEPLFAIVENRLGARLVAGVFDGMGGAGAATAAGSENTFSEAYRASRITRREVMMHCLPFVAEALNIGKPSFRATELAAVISRRLREVAGTMAPSTSRIRGTLTKSFPTTMACAEVRVSSTGPGVRVEVRAVWAGDSRVWVLTPGEGLQQISRDDVSISDPLEQLRQDPPLNNVVSASVEFELREHSVSLTGPCVVICATDGVCGYVRSPGEVELLVLRALERSERTGEPFERVLHDIFGSVAKDDSSATIVAVGFSDAATMFSAFGSRLREVEARYKPLDRDMDAAERSAATEAVWRQEAALYPARMPHGGGEAHA